MKSARKYTFLAVLTVFPALSLARTSSEDIRESVRPATLTPAYCNVAHDVGKLGLTVSNDGTIGQGLSVSGSSQDCFTGETLPRGEWPIGSRTMYLYAGALWIGAVVGTDTLVSTGADGWTMGGNEFHPDEGPFGNIVYRSTIDPKAPWYEGAISEQDYIAIYRDTCRNCTGVSDDPMDGRPHVPLNIEVTQSSYAWSLPYAEDFVLVNYSIKNIGEQPLTQMFVGLYVDPDIHALEMGNQGALDDFTGLRSGTGTIQVLPGCNAAVDVEVAWAADNDGDLGQTVFEQVPHVTGTRLLGGPGYAPQVSYNWYVSNNYGALDFGPMRRINQRDFGTGGAGTPVGDRNKYYLLSNGDRDFDLIWTASISPDDPVWYTPPPQVIPWIWVGTDCRYVVSAGPFNLSPGEAAPFTIAYIAGENLHTNPANMENLPYNPETYLDNLDFSDLTTNAAWAGWVYDNPGVDTDSDGYAGRYEMCGEDTIWYEGDGIPDFRATGPPVPPTFWLEARPRSIWVRWNGFGSEKEIDWATRQVEFEGYRAHLSTTGEPADFSCIGSYDVEDFYRYYWDSSLLNWVLSPYRFTIEEALCLYAPSGCNDPVWYPTDYTRQAPYVMPGFPDSMFYFEPVLANASKFGLETPFVKRYPDAIKPPYERPSDVPTDSSDVYLTPDGFFKYYEYEFLIDRLIPEQPYWVTITAFEYSSLVPQAIPQESEIVGNAKTTTPLDGPCCHGVVGNTSCDDREEISLLDVMILVDFLFVNHTPLCCLEEADVDQSGEGSPIQEDITLLDILMLLDYLFVTGPENATMPGCP